MISNLQKFLGAVFIFSLVAVGLITAAGLLSSNITSGRDQLAEKLGTTSDWPAIRQQISCDLLVPGATRNWIENKLLDLADVEIEDNSFSSTTEITFQNTVLDVTIGRLYLRYDWQDRLIDGDIRDLRGAPVEIDCQ